VVVGGAVVTVAVVGAAVVVIVVVTGTTVVVAVVVGATTVVTVVVVLGAATVVVEGSTVVVVTVVGSSVVVAVLVILVATLVVVVADIALSTMHAAKRRETAAAAGISWRKSSAIGASVGLWSKSSAKPRMPCGSRRMTRQPPSARRRTTCER